ncbi:transketolase [Candidatus Micrarchaeota archaeon]|nr:transketolase [Candidatus Micrarchaeota archaeon]
MHKLEDINSLKSMANTIRQDIIRMLVESKSGHPAGSLGLADIFTSLYFNILKHDPKKPHWEDRDRLVLSNGHVCPVLYASLANAGYFPKEQLMTLRKLGSPLQGHPHKGSLPGIENSSGPLGQGISMAVGMALVGKREGRKWRVYAITGDGEHNEGQVWEALLLAYKYKLDNLVVVVDRNSIQIDGTTEDVLPLEPFSDKYRAFGWNVIEVDGNDMRLVVDAFNSIPANEKPTAIIADTVPGKGVSFMEGQYGWHGKAPNKDESEKAIAELLVARKAMEESP